DLVTCRNLLSYMQPALQERVLELFSYVLQPEGYLFLGSAETVDPASTFFRTLDKIHRIYQRRSEPDVQPRLPALSLEDNNMRWVELEKPARIPSRGAEAERQQHQLLLEEFAPPSLTVNST